MKRHWLLIAVCAAWSTSAGCGALPSGSGCCCTEPCYAGHPAPDRFDRASFAARERPEYHECGGLCGGPLCGGAICGGLLHRLPLWGWMHHEAYAETFEPQPAAPSQARFHPVPTRPVFEPQPYVLPAVYGEPIPPAPADAS